MGTTVSYTADGYIRPDGTNSITVTRHVRPVIVDKAGHRQWGREAAREERTVLIHDMDPTEAARLMAALAEAITPHVVNDAPDA